MPATVPSTSAGHNGTLAGHWPRWMRSRLTNTDAPDRQRYRDALNALAPGGAIIIETLAPEGPDRCSGLPVAPYSPTSLHHELGPGLARVASGDYEHQTPCGAIQAFIWLALRKDSRDSTPRA